MRAALVSLLCATSSRHGRGQIAAALTLGIICGLLPKSCGLFFALLAIIYFLPVHLLLTLAVTIAVSFLSQPVTAWFDQLGKYSLTHPAWSEFWLRLDGYMLIPWLGIHNSVVHGAALVSAGLCLPMLLISHGITAWLMPRRKPTLLEADQVKAFAPASDSPIDMEVSSPVLAVADSQLTTQSVPERNEDASVARLEQVLAEYNSEEFQQVADQDDVLRRATRLVGVVDEILYAIEAEDAFDEIAPLSGVGLEHDTSKSDMPELDSSKVDEWMQAEQFRADAPHVT